MNSLKLFSNKNNWLALSLCSGLLVGLPTISYAQSGSFSNPNPVNQSPTSGASGSQGAQPPLPSQQQTPLFRIAPVNGQVNVKLMNETGAPITYQVIGDTKPRTLSSKAEVMLSSLPMPVTVTFYREDGGLLRVEPQSASEAGMIEVTLRATTDLSTDQNALIVERTGNVFLN